MMMVSLAPFLLVCLTLHLSMLFVVPVPVVYPPDDQYIAANSMETLNYSCTVDVGYTAIWEVNGIQHPRSSQFTLADSGIGLTIVSVDSNNHISMISISNVTRGNLSLQCVALPSTHIRAVKGEEYSVVSFGQPDAVGNLRLVPSDGDLILTWKRPDNVPSEVKILYTIMINRTDTLTNSLNITMTNSFSLRSLEDEVVNASATGVCVMFEFSVSGSNDAGMGQPNTIIDTIPISPDVTLISKELKVERVDLQPFSVQMSFPPVNPCSVNFPLHNYTVKVDDEVTHVVDADAVIPDQDGRVHLKLNSTILSGVALDDSYNLTVTACNDITCRTSDPVTLNTTDVQTVEVIYFRDHLFLRCSFAENSRARGCAIRLSLADRNGTEIYNFSRESDVLPCIETDYRLDEYSEVLVLDIEEDQMLGNGNLALAIDPMDEETTEEMYIEITGCPIVSGMAGGLSSTAAAIVGGVLGPILLIAAIAIVVVTIVVIFVIKKKKEAIRKSKAPIKIGESIEFKLPSRPKCRIEDDFGETKPLMEEEKKAVKKVCDHKDETVIIDIQLIVDALGINQDQIKLLKLQ